MNKKITKAVYVLAGMVLGCFPVLGQNFSEMRTVESRMKEKISEFHSEETNRPDSSVTFSSTGRKVRKTIFEYDGQKTTRTFFDWSEGSWIISRKSITIDVNGIEELYNWDEEKADWIPVSKQTESYVGQIPIRVSVREQCTWDNVNNNWDCYKTYDYIFGFLTISSGIGWTNDMSVENNFQFDGNGNLTTYEISQNRMLAAKMECVYNKNGNPQSAILERFNWKYEFNFNYNLNNQLIECEEHGTSEAEKSGSKRTAEYYDNGKEKTAIWYDWKNNTWKELIKTMYEYDSYGNNSATQNYFWNDGKWELSSYTINYPNSQTSDLEITEAQSVEVDGEGVVELGFAVPEDETLSGKMTVKLPDGITLSLDKTRLAPELADKLDLVITPQPDNSWLIEIKFKGLRSVQESKNYQKILDIAYNVAPKLGAGTYNLQIQNLDLELEDGTRIIEESRNVELQVLRWGTGITSLANSNAWVSGKNLFIRTDNACTMRIYTVSGQLFKQQVVNAGKTIISLPQGTYFVRVGETVTKFIVK